MMTSKHKSSDAGNFIIPYRYNSSILLLLLLIPTVPNLQMKLYQRDAMYRKKHSIQRVHYYPLLSIHCGPGMHPTWKKEE
jgi:hypothetical protein